MGPFHEGILPLNICKLSDAYKFTHWRQFEKNTQYNEYYYESRGGFFDYTMFYGLQIQLLRYFVGQVVTKDKIDEAEDRSRGIFGHEYFNRKGWEYILNKYDGKLPLEISAVPEGTVLPTRNILFKSVNTDPNCAWLPGFTEPLLVQNWYPSTVATTSFYCKQLIQKYCDKTGSELSPFHMNDFGFRGTEVPESAGIGGSAHLINFLGTDTVIGIDYADAYYNSGTCGHSVYATEHSTGTQRGREGELDFYRHILDDVPDNAIVSIVPDGYNYFFALDDYFGTTLKKKILSREGKVVMRPDSGYPPEIAVKTLKKLANIFGYETNDKGYTVINPKVGCIYGDGINFKSGMIDDILKAVTDAKFATENIIFGQGGGLLQDCNRDTSKYAFKCCATKINGNPWSDVYKDPVTDPGKVSKKGRQKLVEYNHGKFKTIPVEDYGDDKLVTVFRNGELVKGYEWNEVVTNASNYPNVRQNIEV
jgi:nicotinamide phosphoribosyltransferase